MTTKRTRERMEDLRELKQILPGEKGTRFYHRALSAKAKARRKARRRMRKRSRR